MLLFDPVQTEAKPADRYISQQFAGVLICILNSPGESVTNGLTTIEIKGGAVIAAPFDYRFDYESRLSFKYTF